MKRLVQMTFGFGFEIIDRVQKVILKAAESLKFWMWVFVTWAKMTGRMDIPTLDYIGFTLLVLGIREWGKSKGTPGLPPDGGNKGLGT